MRETSNNIEQFEEEESFDLKEIIHKYLRNWPWFLMATILTIGLGYVYMRYAPITYKSVAKIKIIDDTKEMNIATDAMALMSGNSKINLENETEVLKSYRLLRQVVEELKLDVAYYEVGNVKTTQIWNPPFIIAKNRLTDSISSPKEYRISISDKEMIITDAKNKKVTMNLAYIELPSDGLPFAIGLSDKEDIAEYKNHTYKVVLLPMKIAVLQLTKDLEVHATNKNSEILSLAIKGPSIDRSEAILNTLIAKFNRDGVIDRQLVSKRTLEVIDQRFSYLSGELDSIEVGKQDFKRANNLSYIEADAGATLQRKSDTQDELYKLENQISVTKILKQTVINQGDYGLLPSNIGIENNSLNNLVVGYNALSLEREKILPNVGKDHPTLLRLNGQLERNKVNIIKTVNIYETQLENSLRQLKQEESRAGSQYSRLPEKEKMLRSIERQQGIKENLFLLLLEKREEAAINLAVTAPSIKVIDYGLTSSIPVSPKQTKVYGLSLVLGMFLPFMVLFIKFSLDTKIYDRSDFEKLNLTSPVLSEIPFLKESKMMGDNDRSVLAESFRILATNVNYMLPKKAQGVGQVIYVTSSVKGEGKTLTAVNLSLAYASMKKKVLLVGADLRNPQLHEYLKATKNTFGLAEYLDSPKLKWEELIQNGLGKNVYHKVLPSGAVPLNAPELLSSPGFGKFMENAKKEFDFIVVDTAPTMLVTDTLLISQEADLTLFVTRSGFTDKRLLEFSKELNKTKKLKNMAYVLNAVGTGKAKDYNYGYGVGYGSDKKQ
ncbi:polysaccharide biosynthesis tyrosine autokinase [Flavobacteriaceae bacterium KMM 6898]|nr:polysaccharide biosynthesis tyrosine autokinase [Flavobacteriaceae bacterium KMM 6898]